MNYSYHHQRLKFIKILPGDPSDPNASSLVVLHTNPRSKVPGKSKQSHPQSLHSNNPAKSLHIPANNPASNHPEADSQDDQHIPNSGGVIEDNSKTSGIARRSPSFRVVHDPSPAPISGERCMTKYEVQYGLRFNTFTKGTIIEDIIIGSRHKVITRNIFKPTQRGGMLALIESDLVPPHPMINPRSYSEDGTYNP